ncbi:hypothetical protein RhiirA5_444230 [Rhizophagus irregularis]|uniref:Uncharacterized protein n=1 Tax=Rhizophagus irregularis TaxID=588596 RepID=A0A2N0NDA2_9GLOM|nr:hypothetical protein RhiirA5_444230 [Rhizophagus irregularis]
MNEDKVDWYLDELVGEFELQTEKLVSIATLWGSLVYYAPYVPYSDNIDIIS